MAKTGVITVGLIGDICAGKSTAAGMFFELGAKVVDADAMVHELLLETDVKQEIRERFSDAVFGANGDVDRKAMADIVFADEKRLAQLGRILYPRTHRRMQQAIANAAEENIHVVVLDAPTLLESGNREVADHLLYIAAPVEKRISWATARGWTAEELERRESRLWPRDKRMTCADRVIQNEGTEDYLRTQVTNFWETIHGS